MEAIVLQMVQTEECCTHEYGDEPIASTPYAIRNLEDPASEYDFFSNGYEESEDKRITDIAVSGGQIEKNESEGYSRKYQGPRDDDYLRSDCPFGIYGKPFSTEILFN